MIIEATIQCAGGKELFEVTCSPDGFDIKINDACRKSFFPQIDFANSFVWGVNTVYKMADHTVNTAVGVVAGSTATCTPKISGTGTVTDTDGTAAFNLKVRTDIVQNLTSVGARFPNRGNQSVRVLLITRYPCSPPV